MPVLGTFLFGTGVLYGPGAGDALVSSQRGAWWVRETPDDPLRGPFGYYEAELLAREISVDLTRSGLSELVTFVGARAGDPAGVSRGRPTVVFMYIRGKKVRGGRTAQYHSKNRLPPTA